MYRQRDVNVYFVLLASRDHVFAINLPASSERIVPMQVSAHSCPFAIQPACFICFCSCHHYSVEGLFCWKYSYFISLV